jgi:hypothetical protein
LVNEEEDGRSMHKKLIVFYFGAIFVLGGCTTMDNVRDFDVFHMGKQRHKIYLRGNSFISTSDLKNVWYKKAKEICPSGFEVEEIEPSNINMAGYNKPVLQGIVICLVNKK